MVPPTKAVFRVKRPVWLDPVLGATILFGPGGLSGAALARPAMAPAIAPAPAPAEVAEPGASVLLDGEPLRLGLMDPASRPPLDLPSTAVDAAPATPEAPAAPDAPDGGPPPPSPSAAPPAELTPTPPANRRLVLNRRRKVLSVIEGTKEVRRYPVAVGMPGWETPVGTFSVIEKRANPTWEHPAKGDLLPPGPANPLGSRWIGFHRDCRGRSGFNGQEHLVVKGCVTAGFHGTPNRGSVGRAVSHGCVRLFDEHAKELFDLVSLGTPVIVLP